tara:strand:+ start:1705 stop:1935 length:231 start_codon:yes stop_codon:yes gene_type:complete
MNKKGFDAEITLNKTLEFNNSVEKPLKKEINQVKKVDINVLKARAQEAQDKENKKNISIFIVFLLALGAAGIYLSV